MWHFRELEVFFWLSDFLFNGFDTPQKTSCGNEKNAINSNYFLNIKSKCKFNVNIYCNYNLFVL